MVGWEGEREGATGGLVGPDMGAWGAPSAPCARLGTLVEKVRLRHRLKDCSGRKTRADVTSLLFSPIRPFLHLWHGGESLGLSSSFCWSCSCAF